MQGGREERTHRCRVGIGGGIDPLFDAEENIPRPDFLVIANTALALGALQELSARGIAPGRDMGVVAFDDVPWATAVNVPLTVVAQPAYETGLHTAGLLVRRIEEPRTQAVERVPATSLITRGCSRRASPDRAPGD